MTAGQRQSLLLLVAGFVVWSVGFVLLYALQAVGCALGWDWHRIVLIVAYALVVLALLPFAIRLPAAAQRDGGGVAVAALWANRAAFVSGVLVFLPVLFVTACA